MAASQVDVQTQSLIDLRSALLAFRSTIGEQLNGIQQYLQRVWEVFEQAEQSAQAEVRRCEEVVAQLQAIATAPGGAVVLPNLLEAAQQLRHAEAHLKKVRHHKREVEQAIQTYSRQAQRLHHHLAHEVPRSTGLVSRKLDVLQQYQAPSPATSSPLTAIAETEPIIAVDSPSHEGWSHRGAQSVRLADLPDPEGINGPADFKKVSYPVMQAGLQRLQEMLPIIEHGEGRSSDYWAQVDQQRGLPYEHGYQRVYEAFYGDTAIRLERIGNQYTIINGRHRLWLAKQMGIETLPAYVVESQGR